jgi:hypothetical protein
MGKKLCASSCKIKLLFPSKMIMFMQFGIQGADDKLGHTLWKHSKQEKK